MAMNWLACHIYNRGNLDRLLVHCLHPLTRQWADTGATSSHFFVRYWNGGPHIRMRLLPSSNNTAPEELVEQLQAEVARYGHVNPSSPAVLETYEREVTSMQALRSRLLEQGYDVQPEEPEPLQPESVQVRPYRFEAERYGGPDARSISEALFAGSTRLAYAAISRTLDAPGKRLALACQLMVAIPRTLGLAEQAAADLFSSQLALHSFMAPGQTAKEFMQHQGFALYRDQAAVLGTVLATATSNFIMEAWQAELATTLNALGELQDHEALQGRPAHILASHLHMMNNRLGISAVQELYLNYLLAEHFAQAATGRR